ncbi:MULTISPECIES: DUF6471 domain-containing protein [unclassified Agarivorans]|uniref:DUF6471 domain-containing protein n=1 Tax=unclassified Agarivorans TaxID=2636026 RepID=UPI0010D0A62E|nr:MULTISPECIES: DUF6471 domain-containing protein [unclassified Agarivorans]MDO6684578.1 DUF6471 domain-containing protein [Agarivorans sp. 3_MG-2023]MDO6714743.1 DUF6471 domain-containing protein [Agarivorans sp. 2_MG-2023]MDO6762864.1 DUF6471 domain-containing protein [Agarivorans sp. 1_MG-2023]GDY24688.1 hypothetical protein AHAT_05780 [Agarivorans sp. Toyoura001]
MNPEQSIRNRQALQPYKDSIKRYIRSAMQLKGVQYKYLSDELAKRDIEMKEGNLRSKVYAGTLPTDLFIILVEILDMPEHALSDIIANKDK